VSHGDILQNRSEKKAAPKGGFDIAVAAGARPAAA
jgi:hypothetical protein